MTTVVRRESPFELGDAALEAKRRLERQQIRLPPRPREPRPNIPDDPTELTDQDLMRLMTLLTKWAEYMSTQLACAEVDERYAESAMEKERALSSLAGEPKSVTEQKARAYENDDFLRAKEVYQTAHAYRKLAQVLYENTDRFSALLSREITRRVSRDPRERRTEKWGT